MDPTDSTTDTATAPRRRGRPPGSRRTNQQTVVMHLAPETKEALRAEGLRHRRSMGRQAAMLIEEAMLIRKLLVTLGVRLEHRQEAGGTLVSVWRVDNPQS